MVSIPYRYTLIHCTHDYFIHVTGSSFSLYHEPFSTYVHCFLKCTQWPQNDFDMFKVRNTMLHIPPEALIFICFTLRWAAFKLHIFLFGKVHWMTPNDLEMSRVKGTHIHTTYIAKAPMFVWFSLRWAVFKLCPFFGKVHRMTPYELNVFKVKNTNMHVTYTPRAQIFICFALWWAVFELCPIFRESTPNDSIWHWHVQGQKDYYASYVYPQRPTFSSVSLYDVPFSSYGSILRKVHQMTP